MTTRALASFAATLSYKDLPASTVEISKRLLLDGIGCLLAGTAGAPGRHAAAMVQECGGNEQATIYVNGVKGSVCQAAFVNGICLYSVGLHDFLQKAGAHPGACVIPTMIAVGEWQRTPGTELLAAMVAGYEVLDRVARSIMPSHRERGFHPTGTCGTFAATAAAGRILGLNPSQMACAFGIAGSQAAGLYECLNDGTATIIFHAGRAAKNGVEAVLLTKAGLTGPATVLEGARGFFRSSADAIDVSPLTSDLGGRYAVHETSFRPYFGVTSTIAASGAMAQIARRRGGIKLDDVERINVICNPVVVQDNAESDPQTLVAARLSMPFNVALVLARGAVLVRDLIDRDLWDPDIRRMLPRIKLIADSGFPRFGSTVEVLFKTGGIERVAMHSWRGDPSEPLTWSDVVDKFDHLVEAVVAKEDRSAIAESVADIENLDGSELAGRLRAAVVHARSRAT